MGPLQLFIFGLLLAWFVGNGKARALITALMTDVQPSNPSDIPNPIPSGPIPTSPGGNPEGGGPGQGKGAPTNPAGPVVPGPLMPHG